MTSRADSLSTIIVTITCVTKAITLKVHMNAHTNIDFKCFLLMACDQQRKIVLKDLLKVALCRSVIAV